MFKNLLIADSGTGHVEEMVRMLRDLPGFRAARINLLHVVPEQGSAGSEEHWGEAATLMAKAIGSMGVDPERRSRLDLRSFRLLLCKRHGQYQHR